MGERFISMRCIFQVFKIHIDSAQGPYTTAETFAIFNEKIVEIYSKIDNVILFQKNFANYG